MADIAAEEAARRKDHAKDRLKFHSCRGATNARIRGRWRVVVSSCLRYVGQATVFYLPSPP